MRLLDFGGWTVAVSSDEVQGTGLARFLDRATIRDPSRSANLVLRLTVGPQPELVVDSCKRQVALTIPEEALSRPAQSPTIAIAVLQAAARCLSLVDASQCALLHGGAVITADGRAVAVLDGGRGQGKTSLALALGATSGQLLADEFLFTSSADGSVLTRPATRLPWHIRQDMTPFLVPGSPATSRLFFPEDLPPSTQPGAVPAVIGVVLLPDAAMPAGEVDRVPADETADALRSSVTDHREKLVDPSLDHVSMFSSAAQITAADGTSLAMGNNQVAGAAREVHALLAQLPVYLVGIGVPSDIGTSAAAVDRVLESV